VVLCVVSFLFLFLFLGCTRVAAVVFNLMYAYPKGVRQKCYEVYKIKSLNGGEHLFNLYEDHGQRIT
jgi:hypothetical protein